MSGRDSFSVHRWWSVVRKEFLQLRRDRITFAMMIGVGQTDEQAPPIEHQRDAAGH